MNQPPLIRVEPHGGCQVNGPKFLASGRTVFALDSTCIPQHDLEDLGLMADAAVVQVSKPVRNSRH